MKIKFSSWKFMGGLGFVFIAIVFYLVLTSYLSPDSQIAFIFAGGLTLGFTILQDASVMKLREELKEVKSQLKRLEEK